MGIIDSPMPLNMEKIGLYILVDRSFRKARPAAGPEAAREAPPREDIAL